MSAYTPGQLADIEAIRALALRYCRGVDRLDAAEMKSAYWPEAIDEHGVFVGSAWEFADFCMPAHAPYRCTMHCVMNHLIALEPDGLAARGEIYNVTYLFPREAATRLIWFGRYLDRYEKRGEEWRIIHRVCVHEADLSEPLAAAMPIDSGRFRQGEFDRPGQGRPIGP